MNDKPKAVSKVAPEAKGNKGGRPSKPLTDIKAGNIPVYVTGSEKERVKAIFRLYASTPNQSMSDFILQAVLLVPQNQQNSHPALGQEQALMLRTIRIELGELKRYLSSIASNYNQVAKRINNLYVAARIQKEVQKGQEQIQFIPPMLEKLTEIIDKITNQYIDQETN